MPIAPLLSPQTAESALPATSARRTFVVISEHFRFQAVRFQAVRFQVVRFQALRFQACSNAAAAFQARSMHSLCRPFKLSKSSTANEIIIAPGTALSTSFTQQLAPNTAGRKVDLRIDNSANSRSGKPISDSQSQIKARVTRSKANWPVNQSHAAKQIAQ